MPHEHYETDRKAYIKCVKCQAVKKRSEFNTGQQEIADKGGAATCQKCIRGGSNTVPSFMRGSYRD